jgi:hypothetical protein
MPLSAALRNRRKCFACSHRVCGLQNLNQSEIDFMRINKLLFAIALACASASLSVCQADEGGSDAPHTKEDFSEFRISPKFGAHDESGKYNTASAQPLVSIQPTNCQKLSGGRDCYPSPPTYESQPIPVGGLTYNGISNSFDCAGGMASFTITLNTTTDVSASFSQGVANSVSFTMNGRSAINPTSFPPGTYDAELSYTGCASAFLNFKVVGAAAK